MISLLLFPISYPIFTHMFTGYEYPLFHILLGANSCVGLRYRGNIILAGGRLNISSLLRERWFALTLFLGLVLYEAVFILSYPTLGNNFWFYVLPTSIAAIVPFTILFPVFKYFNNLNKRIFSFLSLFGKHSLEIYLVQMIYFSTPSQSILGDYVKALLRVSSNTLASVGATFVISLAIITLLALIAAYFLSKLFSLVRRGYRLALKHQIIKDRN